MADNKATPPEEVGPVAAAVAALDRLAERLRAPSIGAQIRRLLPKIETAIESGATHEQIVETLRESGIDISLLTFRSAFYRARAKAAKDSRKGESGGGPKARTAAGKAPKATAETGKPPARDPLAVPNGPKSFEWDPTARPEVTFINKKDEGEPES
jgi:hypothetical protein